MCARVRACACSCYPLMKTIVHKANFARQSLVQSLTTIFITLVAQSLDRYFTDSTWCPIHHSVVTDDGSGGRLTCYLLIFPHTPRGQRLPTSVNAIANLKTTRRLVPRCRLFTHFWAVESATKRRGASFAKP